MKRYISIALFLLTAVIFSACTKEKESTDSVTSYSYVEDKSSYVLENENIKFTLDPSTTYYQVLDKTNGTVWYSNPVDGANDSAADEESKKYLQSTLIVDYSSDIGNSTSYNNFEYSIEKKTYEIEEGQDYIKVKYAVGNSEQKYLIPDGITETRMSEFLENMDRKKQKKIESYYRKYDINNLRTSDNKEELLVKYPELEKECIYALRDGVQEYLKKNIETIFAEAGYTQEDYDKDSAKIAGGAEDENPGFDVSVIYRLENNDLVVELPYEEMHWKENYPMTKLKVLPYFGAGSKEEEGYLLVPEGNGAVINFNNGKSEQSTYYTEMYGWDDAIKRDSVVSENRASFPVFAISKKGGSMMCMLEDNAAVASIEAGVSGKSHSYNFANASYTTLHAVAMELSAKSDKSVMVYESKKPSGSIKQRYRFIDTNQYAKLASSYREYLMDRYPELQKRADEGVPVAVTILGAVDEVKQKLGFPASVEIPLTTYQEANELLKDMKETGYRNLNMKYSGWMNGGIRQSAAESVKTISALGDKDDLKKLMKNASKQAVPFYLEGSVGYVYDDGALDGFKVNRDCAKYASKEIVKLYDFSYVWYGPRDYDDCYYLLKPQKATEYMRNLADSLERFDAKGVAFSEVGHLLSADYNPKNLVTRQNVMEMQQKELKDISSAGTNIMVNNGNDYVLPYVDYVTNMDLYGSKYQILDYSIPFYSMAIHGLVDYSGTSINLSEDYQDMILKSVETGAGLSYTFMKEPTSTLQDSSYTEYYGADYDTWKEEAYRIYSRYDAEMGHCFNQYITDYERLDNGITSTTYEDGTKVYVNYTDQDYAVGDITVLAHDYKVERR